MATSSPLIFFFPALRRQRWKSYTDMCQSAPLRHAGCPFGFPWTFFFFLHRGVMPSATDGAEANRPISGPALSPFPTSHDPLPADANLLRQRTSGRGPKFCGGWFADERPRDQPGRFRNAHVFFSSPAECQRMTDICIKVQRSAQNPTKSAIGDIPECQRTATAGNCWTVGPG